MIDPRFYQEPTPISVDNIIALTQAEMQRGSGSLMVDNVAPAERVAAGGLCFVQSKPFAEKIKDEKGIVCLTTTDIAQFLGRNVCVIISDNPKRDFGIVIKHMFSSTAPVALIDPLAFVAPDVDIGEGCRIEAGVVIEAGVQLGAHCHIKAGAHIGHGCVLGQGCVVEANASVSFTVMGDYGQVGPGAVLGFSGFGVSDHNGNGILPHLGRVIIGHHFHIGANSCIDRGFIEDTVVGDHVMIDNIVQIGHNCRIGNGTIICGSVGIGGSTVIGENNIFGGQCGVADHIVIGSDNVFIGKCGVGKSVGNGQIMAGNPAVPARDYWRELAALRRLAHGRKTSKSS